MKRKITKQSLAELAKVMPVVPEWEMKQMVGGVEFYDLTGNRLGKIGTSDIVRFISPMEYYAISSNTNENEVLQKGSSWNQLGGVSKCDVVRNLVGSYSNLSNLSIGFDRNDSRIMGIDQIIYSDGTPSAAYLYVSDYGSIQTFADLQSILTHENIHAKLKRISGVTGFINRNEEEAYSGQVADPSFKFCSYNFRAQTARYWFENQSHPRNYSEEQIAQFCGVSVHDVYL